MAQRLRLYFGSGRSNTAPEILQGESEEQPGHSGVVIAPHVLPPPVSRPCQDMATPYSPSTPCSLRSEPSLKRSSSMFIPQLAAYAEPRPTKSSSMHISLQRANGSSYGDSTGLADDVPPPCYTPPGPAPAYTEPQIEVDLPPHPPPPYYSPDSLNSQPFSSEPNLPKRRVFSIGSSSPTSLSRSQPGISVGSICIQRNSPEASDVQHFRIRPYGGSASWSLQQQSMDSSSGVNGAQRLVFQLQQNQNLDNGQDRQQPSEEQCGDSCNSPRSCHTLRYPRIRFQRSTSHQRLLLDNKHLRTGAESPTVEGNKTDEYMEARNASNGCTFKISGEATRRQPRLKIYFTPGTSGDPDVSFGSASTSNDPKVNNIKI